jgi:hypothetical protein
MNTQCNRAVGCSAWLDVSHADLFFICFAALGIAALVEAYLSSDLIEKRLRVRLYFAKFPSAILAVWTLISFGFFLLEATKLRFQIRVLSRRLIKLSQENRDLVLKHREMLALNGGGAVLGDELLDEVERVHTSNENSTQFLGLSREMPDFWV